MPTTSDPSSPKRPCLGAELGGTPLDELLVKEVERHEEKKAALDLHLSKNTFHEERHYVKYRIFRGPTCKCRTWILLDPRSVEAPAPKSASSRPASKKKGSRGDLQKGNTAAVTSILAAVTLRLNVYQHRPACWAQILNMSTRRERYGLGTLLIAGLQELLLREGTDVVVLYPAQNGRAPLFWSSIGFGGHETSLLPAEELVPHDQDGPLFPEFDPRNHDELPRWEKRIGEGLPPVGKGPVSKRRGQPARPVHRFICAAASRIGGEALQTANQKLHAHRARWKAEKAGGSGVSAPSRAAMLMAEGRACESSL